MDQQPENQEQLEPEVPLALEEELTPEELADEATNEDIDAAEIEGNLQNILEALIFASDDALNAQNFKDILKINIDAKKLRHTIQEINKKLQAERRPFEIVEIGGGFQYRTIPGYQKYLRGLFKDKAIRRLSGQALETLAIIAYKQPVSKAEIESIRSVNTDSSMKTLLEKRLIKLLGKSEEKPGKPIVYGTTKDFLKYFGLNRISDLPKIEEFEELAKDSEKTELIKDFKRDDERTVTMQPRTEYKAEEEVAAVQDAAPPAVLTEEEQEEIRLAEEADENPADDALPPEVEIPEELDDTEKE